MKKYIVALDQGTTSSRAIVFDLAGKPVSTVQYPFRQYYPKPGWVSHDAEEIASTELGAFAEAVKKAGIRKEEIAAVGITNQRETTIAWDKETGKPCCQAIVWQCRRTAEICRELEDRGEGAYVKEKTGLPIDAYFSGTKCRWMLENEPEVRAAADRGTLAFGTVDAWLIWKLTGGKSYKTDVTNASRTMLFDIGRLCYDRHLCELCGVTEEMLPQVLPSGSVFGEVDTEEYGLGFLRGLPICSVLGDQQAALFGQRCFTPGDTKNTYGTGCFTLMNVGDQPSLRAPGLITTVGWQYGDRLCYALEGSVFNGGSSIQWLRDELGIIKEAADVTPLAESVPDNGGVYFVSAFNGLGAPHWDMYARGGMLGLTRGANKGHIARAVLEGIAYQVYDLTATMEAALGKKITVLKADGGASASGFLMEFQSGLLGTDVVLPSCRETTALGAALLAGLVSGIYQSEDDLPRDRDGVTYHPAMEDETREALLAGWRKATERVKRWENG